MYSLYVLNACVFVSVWEVLEEGRIGEGGVEGYFSETAVIQSVFSLSLARMRTALFIVYVLPVLIVVAQATPGETTLHLSSFLGGTW